VTPLALDALDSSRPIVADVRSSAEIEAMFDPLTYEKGAAVLRMIEQFVGVAPFRDGIRAYIARHQFRNTVAADLWRELEASSGRPVGALAKDWLTQAGYPIVTAVPRPTTAGPSICRSGDFPRMAARPRLR
jgi:puromycin-sensitive aminopeptidase